MPKQTKKPAAPVQDNTPLENMAGGNQRRTAKERVAYHREQANAAFKTDDKVKAYGHVKAHGRAKEQLNWWMRLSPEQKADFIAGKSQKNG